MRFFKQTFFLLLCISLTGCGGGHSKGYHLENVSSDPSAILKTNPSSFYLPPISVQKISKRKWSTGREAAIWLRQSLIVHGKAGGIEFRTDSLKPYDADARAEIEILKIHPVVQVHGKFVHIASGKILAEFDVTKKSPKNILKLSEDDAAAIVHKILDDVSKDLVKEVKANFGL